VHKGCRIGVMSRSHVIAIGALAGAFSWAVFELIITALGEANVTVIVAIIAASGTIATGVIGALITQAQSKDREILVQGKIQERQIQEAHRDKKVQVYTRFLGLASAFLQGENPNNKKKTPRQQKVLDEFEKIQNGMLLWGSPEVIKAFLRFRHASEVEGSENVLKVIDALYLAFRADIGLSNSGLESHELIQMYLRSVKDIEQLLAS